MTRREVVPSHRLPLLVQTTTTVATDPPSLVARSPSSSETAACGQGSSCEKPTSNLTTTVIPVVLGAGYVEMLRRNVLRGLERKKEKANTQSVFQSFVPLSSYLSFIDDMSRS